MWYDTISTDERSDLLKLNENFIVHTENDETLLVPTAEASFSGIARGNKTFSLILSFLEKGTSRDEIVRSLRERFDAPDGEIEANVDETLSQLRNIGAIDE